jgi:signal recognition particle subunit SRP54
MFDNLQSKMERAIKTLKGEGRITEINVSETAHAIRRALLDADVNYKVAKQFTDEVKQKALGQRVLAAINPGQLFTKIVHDELAALMGSQHADINIHGSPAVIMLCGLQGSGKTTFAAKLGAYLHKRGRATMLAACDIHRPAAAEQLRIMAEQAGCGFYSEEKAKDAAALAKNAVSNAKRNNYAVVIIDTAGRMAVDEIMMQEASAIKRAVQPCEILFAADAMTGQDAANTAQTFNERLDFDGVVLTKMDGDSRGGAALTIRAITGKPIKFIGAGEKIEDIQVFHPDRMADRILGMGDVVTLVERVQEQFDEEEEKRLKKRIAKNEYDYNDFLRQIHKLKKVGNFKDIMGMLPGMGKFLGNIELADTATYNKIEAIINSMTPYERSHPKVIDGSRRRRIAAGSGRSLDEVVRITKHFDAIQKMHKQISTPEGLGNAVAKFRGKKMPSPNF